MADCNSKGLFGQEDDSDSSSSEEEEQPSTFSKPQPDNKAIV